MVMLRRTLNVSVSAIDYVLLRHIQRKKYGIYPSHYPPGLFDHLLEKKLVFLYKPNWLHLTGEGEIIIHRYQVEHYMETEQW